MVKILTINVKKGGTGKTTTQFNFTDWLANEDKKVLVIDADYSCNATATYNLVGKDTQNNIANIFRNKPVEIIKVNNNIDIITGSPEIEQINNELITKQNNCLVLFMWIADNYSDLEKYDYIVIDTHNDKSLVTKNCLAVADIILGVSDPSPNGFTALLNLEDDVQNLKNDLINIVTRESYISAKVYFIANNVQHNVSSHRDFLSVIEKSPNYLGTIQRKALLGNSLLDKESIVEKQKVPNIAREHKLFYDQTYKVYTEIKNKIDEGE